jgi:hypothetical protein
MVEKQNVPGEINKQKTHDKPTKQIKGTELLASFSCHSHRRIVKGDRS